MKQPSAPRIDERRAKEFEQELFERARAWIPTWAIDDNPRDFGRALLKVAARFSSEVAQRLDRAGEKLRLGFLDWLAIMGNAARPARLPVVFKLADSARDARFAPPGTRLQVDAGGSPVILETESDVNILPGTLAAVVGVDADADVFCLPPPGLSSLAPLDPLPSKWELKSFASAGATNLQLDPVLGLVKGMLVELGGQQYRIGKPQNDIIPVDPPLSQNQAERSIVAKVTGFAPFAGAHDEQQHALYLGHQELFDITAAATIEIVGAKLLADTVAWHYWGKKDPNDQVDWQPLMLGTAQQQAQSDAIVLLKPKGSMESLELVPGTQSRWIRASVGSVKQDWQPLLVERFEIRLNCRKTSGPGPSPPPPEAAPAAEGLSNTTPLVLDGTFFPFGKEPRQFDAFYLGSKEAFSKKGADVTLSFELADPTFTALSAVRTGLFADTVLAGVAQDGALHLLEINATTGAISRFRDREALRPPPMQGNAQTAPGVPLDPRPIGRLPVWYDAADTQGFLVAIATADTVWVYRESSGSPSPTPWTPLQGVPTSPTEPNAPTGDIVFIEDLSMLFALRGGKLSARKWPDDTVWNPVPATDLANNTIVLDAIVPVLVLDAAGRLVSSSAAGMIGVSRDRRLYSVSPLGNCADLGSTDVSLLVRPVAVQRSLGRLFVAFTHRSNHNLVTIDPANGETAVELDINEGPVRGFEVTISGGNLYFLAAVQSGAGGYLASWTPPDPGAQVELFRSTIPAGTGQPDGAPTLIAGHVIIPGNGADVLTTDLDFTRRLTLTLTTPIGQGVLAPASAPALQVNDEVTLDGGASPYHVHTVTDLRVLSDIFYSLDTPFADGQVGALYAFRAADPQFQGNTDQNASTITLDAADQVTVVNSFLKIGALAHRVTGIAARTASLDPAPAATNNNVPYGVAIAFKGRLAPYLSLDGTNNNWDIAELGHATLVFPGAVPREQTGRAFHWDPSNRPLLIVLATAWSTSPPGLTFVLDAAAASWVRFLGDTSNNPELSWEYWNGNGWWRLAVLDNTLHLKLSGTLTFTVPPDTAPTDWSGRTNYWIRARLVGGDYGRESVSVATSPPDHNGVTHQTVERSTKDIHAPAVVKLGISYELCSSVVLPDFVLTKDSGSLHDQSDANRTAGAKVEAFVPVGVLLGRLSGPTRDSASTQENCQPDCDCPSTSNTVAASAQTPAAAAATATSNPSTPASGRALYLGFDTPLSGEPVNVLFLVDREQSYDAFAPMTVEALIAERFVPIVVQDATRALGESGVLSLVFEDEPTRRELFGQSLMWLRLTPKAPKAGNPASGWSPALRGAYLNAVWATAAETVTYELVGSSQAEPSLTLHLSRPPLLQDTLELRVREPLGEEERAALSAMGQDQVLSAVESLSGDWVLWRRVIDPDDEPPTERVYALDESTGEIRFGDGQHGMIPPIGRDSIVAFKYRRTEAGPTDTRVPANSIAPRTSVNLVSPIDTVESVFAADQAAGGAPPESTERVLRFGVASLRHRKRAVTAADLEDLTLASSPDIAQARCFIGPGFVRLVVIMRGLNPVPNAAQMRELHDLLVAESPPSLSASQALRIGGPKVRVLRVELRLRVASLDYAGEVARDAKEAIVEFFDTLTGGPAQDGWALGDNPTEADVAMALVSVPRLEGIEQIALREVAPDGIDRPWPSSLKTDELAMLGKDVIRVGFETVGVIA